MCIRDSHSAINEKIDRHQKLTAELNFNGIVPEQERVLPKFAAVHLGLQLAIEMGLINITLDDAQSAVEYVVKNWLANANMLSDIDQGIENIRTFIRTQPRKFANARDKNDRPNNIVGYREDVKQYYLIVPSQFELVCGKSHTREILKSLVTKGFLKTNNTDGNGNVKFTSRHKISGEEKLASFYAVRYELLHDE